MVAAGVQQFELVHHSGVIRHSRNMIDIDLDFQSIQFVVQGLNMLVGGVLELIQLVLNASKDLSRFLVVVVEHDTNLVLQVIHDTDKNSS